MHKQHPYDSLGDLFQSWSESFLNYLKGRVVLESNRRLQRNIGLVSTLDEYSFTHQTEPKVVRPVYLVEKIHHFVSEILHVHPSSAI